MAESVADPEVFRKVMGVFPSPVSVVTSLDEQGVPRGLTCSAVSSLSMAPPSLLVCVNRGNRSLDAIRHSQGFVVNLLGAGRADVSDAFASPSPNKFDGRLWRPSPASGLPLLFGDAIAFVDCDLHAEVVAGSHAILIGLVRESGTNVPTRGPLVYWRRTYGRWVPAADEQAHQHSDVAHRQGDDMSDDQTSARILAFIRETFLGDDPRSELDEETPLLEWGVLNSMNTAVLLTYIRDEVGVRVPPDRINGRNFKNTRSIAAMIAELAIAANTPSGR
jgi:flavin reductase (DIM6/NTAB) family NADH-FMN oxidoreductase RutF/acyl carrier protein